MPTPCLPITEFRAELVKAIRDHQQLVIIGDTGSGKTTQIPQYIYENLPDLAPVVITQPRRIAAITVAKRVAKEQGCKLGSVVGYAVRFEDCSNEQTRLRYVTDGLLLREATQDASLRKYKVVIVDEAHERTLDTDVLFGLLKRARQLRPELKILVMSATLDVEKFSDFFDQCPLFHIPGRVFPVDILHHRTANFTSLKSTYCRRVIDTVVHVHANEPPGDVLVFLTGRDEIEAACLEISELCEKVTKAASANAVNDLVNLRVEVWPLYASLETLEQTKVFQEPLLDVRKIVVATNIAQTSVTIPGIRYVVDSGYVKQKTFDPQTGMDALLVIPVSQAAATQRAGRAGSRDAYDHLLPETTPEIQRSSLMAVVLSLKRMGIDDVLSFEFVDPPDSELLRNALVQLFLLGALDEYGHITKIGREMAMLPISPNLSRSLLAATQEFNCLEEMLHLTSMLSVGEEIWIQPREEKKKIEAERARDKYMDVTGDHLTLVKLWESWKRHHYSREWCRKHWVRWRMMESALRVEEQLKEAVERLGYQHNNNLKQQSKESTTAGILQALSRGYFMHTAKRHMHRPVFYHYLASTTTDQKKSSHSSLLSLHLSPDSVLDIPVDDSKYLHHTDGLDWVIYHEVVYTNKAIMRIASKVERAWVAEGLARTRSVNVERLLHGRVASGGSLSGGGGGGGDKLREMEMTPSLEIVQDKKRRRQELIDAAKQRFKDRKKLE